MTEPVIIGDAQLWLGDCREILPTLGRVDAVVTDPPYGVGFTGKGGAYRNERNFKSDNPYLSYEDTPENFESTVLEGLHMALERARSGLVFMSNKQIQKLPVGEVGGIYSPNGTGRTAWGFNNFMLCVFYGPDPYLLAGMGSRPNGRYGIWANDANEIAHPCAKPIAAMEWAVGRASLAGQTILDPFAGSGTTGVACAKLGRKFIGVEIEKRYFDIACRRIEEAYRQPRLFADPVVKPKQEAML